MIQEDRKLKMQFDQVVSDTTKEDNQLKTVRGNNFNSRQSDVNKKYYSTHLLLSAESDLKKYNSWIISKFIKNVRVHKDAKVMDFGAGIGTLAGIFFRATGLKPELVELDPEQRKIIEKRWYKSYSGLEKVQGKYDLIFTSNVLEHIEDDVSSLVAIKSKLTEDGSLVIFVPAFEVIWSAMDDCVGHYRRYSKQMLTKKLIQGGFTVNDIRYCDSLGFVLSFLFKYLGSKNGEPSSVSLRIFDKFLLPISKFLDVLVMGKFGKNIIAIASLNSVSEGHLNEG